MYDVCNWMSSCVFAQICTGLDNSLANVEIGSEMSKLPSKSYEYANILVNSEELPLN